MINTKNYDYGNGGKQLFWINHIMPKQRDLVLV